MNKVYAVGVLQLDIAENARRTIHNQRLWHLYVSFEEAEKCVLENRGDIFEYSYNFALIEEIYVIDPSNTEEVRDWFPPKEWWYEATFSSDPSEDIPNPSVVKVEKPKCLEKTIYFWVG